MSRDVKKNITEVARNDDSSVPHLMTRNDDSSVPHLMARNDVSGVPHLMARNDDSSVPYLMARIKQELDNETKHKIKALCPFPIGLINMKRECQVFKELIISEDVNIEDRTCDIFDEKMSYGQKASQSGLCEENVNIKYEFRTGLFDHFTNSQDDVQKIKVESEYSVQHSQLVRSDVFSENLPEQIRDIEEKSRDVTKGLKRLAEHIRNIVKNTSDDDFEMVHEHKENIIVKIENMDGDLCFRKQRLNDLRESMKLRECQVMVTDVTAKISQNDDNLTVNDGDCSNLSENEFYVSKKDSRHAVSNVSCENLEKSDVCGVGLTKLVSLNTDRKKYEGEKSDKCPVSNLDLTCSDNQGHVRKHTEDKNHEYGVCNIGVVQGTALNRDLYQHEGMKLYKCEFCDLEFTRIKYLQNHRRTHTGEKPYKCDVCGVRFTRTDGLKAHQVKHTGEKPYTCDFCGIGFTRTGGLQRHRRTHTGEKPYKCDVCGVGFTQIDCLKNHKRKHTGEKPYICDVCGIRFTHIGSLKRHRRTHTGEKPYKCDVCGIEFSHTCNLKIHRRTHTGEKPYKCDVCGVGFSQIGSLKIHRRTHTGEKPYKCDVCNIGFSHTGNLKTHRRTHTGEKPYKCNVCGVGFTQTGSLKIHLRAHTVEKSYKCVVCGDHFTHFNAMKKHIKAHLIK